MHGQPKSYRGETVCKPVNRRTWALKTIIGNVQKILDQVEPQTKTCFVCEKPFSRTEIKPARYKHRRIIEMIGQPAARQLHRKLRRQYGKIKHCPELFTQKVHVYLKPIPVQVTIEERTIVARVCSEECRQRHASHEKGYDECIVHLHNNWQQVKAIRAFLKTSNLDALLSLPMGLRPDRSSLLS